MTFQISKAVAKSACLMTISASSIALVVLSIAFALSHLFQHRFANGSDRYYSSTVSIDLAREQDMSQGGGG